MPTGVGEGGENILQNAIVLYALHRNAVSSTLGTTLRGSSAERIDEEMRGRRKFFYDDGILRS